MGGEPAILAHKQAAVAKVTVETGQECLLEQVSKGQSSGNGLAEGAVKEVKAKDLKISDQGENVKIKFLMLPGSQRMPGTSLSMTLYHQHSP